jgi:hypothetical protein
MPAPPWQRGGLDITVITDVKVSGFFYLSVVK